MPLPRIEPGPVLVADSSASLASETGLSYLFWAIFETPVLAGEPLRLFERARANPTLWANRDLLLTEVRNWLIARLDQDRTNDEIRACLQAISRHEVKARTSREAYVPGSKPFHEAVFWPFPAPPHNTTSLFERLPLAAVHRFVMRTTPIGSAGSCFAVEIAHRLQRDGYNYVVTEPNPSGLANACAAWGAIFNTPSFRQLVEKAFGKCVLPKILFTRGSGDETRYFDPFREDVVFRSPEEWAAGCEAHLLATREALLRCRVFVFTLGMNEVWRLKSDGTVFSRAPWSVMPDLVEQRVLSVEENVRELQAALDLLRAYNPDIKLILSVSPVPLHATFRGHDTHVVTANCHSKSTLRVVAEEFVARNSGVYYFPSYEVVTQCTRNPWHADQRHVSPEAVENVMRLFGRMFVAEEAGCEPGGSDRRAA